MLFIYDTDKIKHMSLAEEVIQDGFLFRPCTEPSPRHLGMGSDWI